MMDMGHCVTEGHSIFIPQEDQQSKALFTRVPFMIIKTMTALLNL